MSATATSGCLVFLASFCVLWIQMGCEPASITCSTNGDQNSTCHRSGLCYEEHSIPEQLDKCKHKQVHINKTVSFSGYNITECERGRTGFDRCNAVGVNLKAYLVRSLPYAVVPLDAKHFSMNVSWTWFEEDFKRAHSQLVGYELWVSRSDRLSRNKKTVKCLCIWEPDLRSVSLGYDPVLQYKASSFNMEANMEVRLFTLPYEEKWHYRQYSSPNETTWPITCKNYDIGNGTTFCPVRLPSVPTGVKVLSRLSADVTKELDVSWVSESAGHPPEIYYTTVLDDLNNVTLRFVVNRSRHIKISGLRVGTNYSVQVQGYSMCSGISSFYSGFSSEIGCGTWSELMNESFQVPITVSPTGSTRYPPSHDHHVIFISSTITMAVLILAILLVVILSVSIFLYRKWYSMRIRMDPSSIHLVDPLRKLDALVLYSQSTPTLEKIEIEQYVVSFLKHARFKVLSCNDHTERTIVQWVEENARSAHTVFIVCNKHFCKEWTMQFRTPLLNSLEMIITSAVGQKSIEKYATVLLRPSDEQYIPNHLYLKGMRSFVVGARATPRNREEFIGFIKMHRLTSSFCNFIIHSK